MASVWNWHCVREGWPEIWVANNCGHKIEATRTSSSGWTVSESGVQIINHLTGRTLTFRTLAEIRRWFDSQREVQARLIPTPHGKDE